MKKIIAFIMALAALSCTLTACGSTDDSSSSGKSASSSAASSASESGTYEENGTSSQDGTEDVTASGEEQTGTSMGASTEPEELSGHIVDDDAPYMADLKNMIDCLNNKDFTAYIKYMYPKEFLDAALKAQGHSLEEMAQEMANGLEEKEEINNTFPIKLGKVAEYDTSDEMVKQMRAGFEETLSGSSDDTSKISEQLGFDIKKYIEKLKDCKIIDVEMISADGKSETETFMAYEADGEGWKFDITMMSMLSYVKKSKKVSANSAASSIDKAAISTITDIDEKDGFPADKFVLGTNSSLDVNVPANVDAEALRKGIKNYFDKVDDYNYFVVIQNADVIKVVCEKKDSDGNVGMYPADNDSTETYEELYKKAKAGELYNEYQEKVTEKLKDNE